MDAFAGRGMVIQGLRFLSPREALPLLEAGAVLVDLRPDELFEMKAFTVPACIHIPHHAFPDLMAKLPADRPLLVADAAGVYTKEAAHLLLARGFTQVACLNGGLLAWDQEGLPVTTDPEAMLYGECACVMKSRKGRP
jgi:rhodanese-related sulfurtransferase